MDTTTGGLNLVLVASRVRRQFYVVFFSFLSTTLYIRTEIIALKVFEKLTRLLEENTNGSEPFDRLKT